METLLKELESTEWSWVPETVYLGGGTPSNLPAEVLKRILERVPGSPWREATIEAAPGGLTPEVVSKWRDIFINRISFGVQSFNTEELKQTGRKHTAETVRDEVALLLREGIESINVDLIAGLPGQSMRSWQNSLDWVERLGVPHVSVYMLEVDDDSRLGREIELGGTKYGASDVPTDDAIAEFYEIAVERLAGTGIERYEISNFARPGFESLHNLKYWKRQPYFGFGADAHSFDGESRWQNAESPADYVHAGVRVRSKTLSDPVAERFFLGLRLSEGIAGDLQPFDDVIKRFEEQGLLERTGERVRLTSRGVLLSNEVFQEFISTPV